VWYVVVCCLCVYECKASVTSETRDRQRIKTLSMTEFLGSLVITCNILKRKMLLQCWYYCSVYVTYKETTIRSNLRA